MNTIFRKMRYNVMERNKTTKYFKYAIGEIVLVVIGILIALQLNNWNQNQNITKQLKNYKTSLISEIQNDLKELDRIDSINVTSIKSINDYFSYFNTSVVNMDTLNIKANYTSNYSTTNNFYSNIFSIDELIASGNISLFTQKEKLAIIRLKKQIELYTYYEKEALKNVNVAFDKLSELTDLAFERGQTLREHTKVQKLRSDINSDYYRRFNNGLTTFMGYYEYQDYIYSKRIRPQLLELKKVLSDTVSQ